MRCTLFTWLPIIYYARVNSVPEYFERRFDRRARAMATVILLLYMIGYIGINLLTMGKVAAQLLGYEQTLGPVFISASIVAVVCAAYVTTGGQAAVILSDVLQGVLLLAAGLMRLSRRLVRKTESTFDDQLLKAGAGPLTATVTVALFNATTLPLRLSVPAQRVVGEVCQALIVVTITWLAMRIVDLGVGLIEDRFRERGETTAITVLPIGRRVVKVFLIILAVLSGLQNMGYNVTGLVAGLGVGGLAVALAAQKTFEDFFGAMSILVDQPIKRGEFGRFGDKVGTVEDIGLRSTRIRTSERTLVTIPNAEFASLQIENFTARDRIRFVTILGLRYETSADQLRHVLIRLRELLREHPYISPDPARVRFIGFGASSLDIEVFAYFTTVDWNEFMSLREELLLRIIDLVEASGTGFAFPSQTLYLGSDAGLDETRAREAERQIQAWRSDGSLEGKT